MKRLITILLLMSSCVTEKEKQNLAKREKYFTIACYNFDLANTAFDKGMTHFNNGNLDSYSYYISQYTNYIRVRCVYIDSFCKTLN